MSHKVKMGGPTSIGFGTFDAVEGSEGGPVDVAGEGAVGPVDVAGPEGAPDGPLASDVRVCPVWASIDSRWVLAGLPEPALAGLAEVLSLQVAVLPQLAACSILVECDGYPHGDTGTGGLAIMTTSRRRYAQAQRDGIPVFVGGEYIALANAAKNGRIWMGDFARFVAKKKANPTWRLRQHDAFGGYCTGALKSDWTLERLLNHLCATLIAYEVD